MTTRDKLLAAFTPAGTPHGGVVASYAGLFMRDHWSALTAVPWWYAHSGLGDWDAAWARDVIRRTGLEWLEVQACASRAERARQRFERRADGVWRVDPETGEAARLLEPLPGGTNTGSARSRHADPAALPATPRDVDALIPLPLPFDLARFHAEGRHDAAAAIRGTLDVMLYGQVVSPLWSLYERLGYEGLMLLLAGDPELAAYAADRMRAHAVECIHLIAALGADAVWIEECLTDQISPALFRALNVPLLQACVREIRACGLRSIYYFCGNPHDRREEILEVGADAVHFEESKKSFVIDIADVLARVRGRCTVFGNVDALGVLQDGSDTTLRAEIARQLTAGQQHGGRFILSTGSPITPGTPVERVRRYTDLARELGA